MCGIAGIFLQDKDKTPAELLLLDMIKTIAHRGPDAQQCWVQPGLGLAHARLSIIDLDPSSNQPMQDPITGNKVVFNGEIYNYIELKNELLALGYEFHTKGDTEVILKAYAHWGIDCLNKFNGMWAIALYDERKKTLFCSRDRVGIKPFVYGITPQNDIVFASEAKAIVAHFPEFKQVNMDFLKSFIESDFFACYKETFNKNVFNLLPGHYFEIKAGETPIQKRYWSWTPKINLAPGDDKSIKATFRELFTDSIKLRFRSDVPVGACLSGGMDSSTIVGLASEMFDKRIHTFSCIYPNTPQFDESHYIKESVNKFNTIPKFIEPKHDDFIDLVHQSIYEQDGPTGGPSILSQRAVMELASKDVKVVLDGQGADELLGGYHSYFRYSLIGDVRNIKRSKSLNSLWTYWNNASQVKKRSGSKASFAELMACTLKPVSFYSNQKAESQLNYFNEFEHDDLNTMLLEHVFTNLSNLLHYEDRNSMRFSIESRLPFLDYRLIEFAFSLPAKYKIRGSTTKWLLQDVAKSVLPKEVYQRKDKMGFSTPAHLWFLQDENLAYFKRFLHEANPLFANLTEYMRNYLLKSFGLLSAQKNNTIGQSGDINALWRFFTANMWFEGV